MNPDDGWGALRLLVVVLLAVQVIAVVLAWLLNPLGAKSQTEYVLLLSADLVSFALISYIGRAGGRSMDLRGGYLLAGSGVVLFFMFLVLLA